MKRRRFDVLSVLALAGGLMLPIACSDSGTSSPLNGTGTSRLVVRLTDAPFSTDSVQSVDIFVVRVEGRAAATDDMDANANLEDGGSAGWQVLATPNASFNLLALQNGASATLGEAPVPAGTYDGFRFIIDPSKSSVTLKNGRVLTGTSVPDVTFPSASKSGIKIVLSEAVKIVGGATTTLLIDFDVNNSFVQRGNSIEKNGLLFKPVIKGSIVDAATVNATIRLANATDAALTLLQNGTALTGASAVAFGTSSTCNSVTAATPLLTLVPAGMTTILPGFAPVLLPGLSYTLVAYPGLVSVVQFATLSNEFTPTAGQGGLRVFNASGSLTGLDVYVTATGAPLTVPTVSNVLTGTAANFVDVPDGPSQVRVTATASTTVLLDVGSQTITAGKNTTLVIAPAAVGSTTLRAFLVPAC
jgi:Domain of unknown function (DUF4382)